MNTCFAITGIVLAALALIAGAACEMYPHDFDDDQGPDGAEARLEWVTASGARASPMFYQDEHGRADVPQEWKSLVRRSMRPSIRYAAASPAAGR